MMTITKEVDVYGLLVPVNVEAGWTSARLVDKIMTVRPDGTISHTNAAADTAVHQVLKLAIEKARQ